MVNILLIIAFTGAIAVSIIFAGVTFLQGVQSTLDAQITHQRLLDVATQIQSHGRIVGGYFALPQGATGSSPYAYNQVPSWITGNAVGANGVPFEYCPYASTNQGGTSGTVTMGDSSTTYNIDYTNNAATISQNYVTDNNGTTTPFTGAVGLLVAAAPNRYYPPNCSSVTSSNGYPVVTGGIAVSIQNDYLNKTQIPTAMTDMKFYVSTAASGDGSGRDTSNYTTLSNALTMISTLQPAGAMIYLALGTYSTSDSLSHGTRLYLNGISGTVTINATGNLTIDEYSTLSLANLTLNSNSGAGTITVNGTLEMDGAASTTSTLTAAALDVYGGKITTYTNGTTFNVPNVTIDGGGKIDAIFASPIFNSLANRGFNITNGYLAVYGGIFNIGTANIVPVFIGAGGTFVGLTSITTTINGANSSAIAGGVIVDPGGRLIPSGAIIINKATNYGYYIHGKMTLYQTTLTYHGNAANGLTNGIVLASGGGIEMSQFQTSTLGASSPNDPVNAVNDLGGSIMMSSSNNAIQVYAATNCWNYSSAPQGVSLFMDSPVGTTSANVATTNNIIPWLRLYNNSDVFTCHIS